MQMANDNGRRPYYWERYVTSDGRWAREPAPGADLAALRRGLGRAPGDVPAMWPFYTTLTASGAVTRRLAAEHAALTLFAVHQQSRRTPAHCPGVGVGAIAAQLRDHKKTSNEAVERRFGAAATATSYTEVVAHLRGLITQFRLLDGGLDYTRLVEDLRLWQQPEHVASVRRRWGGQFFSRASTSLDVQAGSTATVEGDKA
jgi:CRISPR system Cascade subunit CasB